MAPVPAKASTSSSPRELHSAIDSLLDEARCDFDSLLLSREIESAFLRLWTVGSFAKGSEVPGNGRIKMEWHCKTLSAISMA